MLFLITSNAITVDASKEAMLKFFGWKIRRAHLEKWNPETKELSYWENTYFWEEENRPTEFPACLENKVVEVGLSQPGRLDEGQPDAEG